MAITVQQFAQTSLNVLDFFVVLSIDIMTT